MTTAGNDGRLESCGVGEELLGEGDEVGVGSLDGGGV